MKTKQNRNKKRAEIKRFDWFIERIQTHLPFGWLSERTTEKTSCPQNVLKIASKSYCNRIGQSKNAFSILGFSLAGKRRVHACFVFFIHWLLKLSETIFQGHTKLVLTAFRNSWAAFWFPIKAQDMLIPKQTWERQWLCCWKTRKILKVERFRRAQNLLTGLRNPYFKQQKAGNISSSSLRRKTSLTRNWTK